MSWPVGTIVVRYRAFAEDPPDAPVGPEPQIGEYVTVAEDDPEGDWVTFAEYRGFYTDDWGFERREYRIAEATESESSRARQLAELNK